MKLDKLEALLGDGAEPGDVSLIAEMLSLSGGERFPPLDLRPQRKKERTLAALLRQLQALARHQPVLMIFENLHWIDPTSRDARYRPTELRRRLRKWGLPSGMRRPRCCGHAQGTHQTALSFLRQWRVPCGMRRAKWGRSRAEAIIAEFPGSRGATRQELDGQETRSYRGRSHSLHRRVGVWEPFDTTSLCPHS